MPDVRNPGKDYYSLCIFNQSFEGYQLRTLRLRTSSHDNNIVYGRLRVSRNRPSQIGFPDGQQHPKWFPWWPRRHLSTWGGRDRTKSATWSTAATAPPYLSSVRLYCYSGGFFSRLFRGFPLFCINSYLIFLIFTGNTENLEWVAVVYLFL